MVEVVFVRSGTGRSRLRSLGRGAALAGKRAISPKSSGSERVFFIFNDRNPTAQDEEDISVPISPARTRDAGAAGTRFEQLRSSAR